MSSVQFTFNMQRFRNLVGNKHEKVAKNRMKKLFTEQLEKPLRENYPNTTKRRNGEIVTSPRNVVDLGTLVKSLKVTVNKGKTRRSITFTWAAPYAEYIYEGTDKQPAYPWVELALLRLDYKNQFDKS